MVPGDNCLHRSPLRGVGVPSPVTLAGSKCGLLTRHWSPLRGVGAVYSPEEEEEEEEEEALAHVLSALLLHTYMSHFQS